MLYAISRGAVEGYSEGQSPVIYICSTAEAVKEAGLRWVFTEGHADMDFTDFFDDLKAQRLEQDRLELNDSKILVRHG